MKPKILCFTDYYLPGFRGGGPIRTIANMVAHLNDEFEFWIVTRDRDLLANVSYPNILVDDWNIVGNAKVFYASPTNFSFIGVLRLLRSMPFDILYLNSFFSPVMTIQPLLIHYFGLCRQTPVVLAPRGEFSSGAMALKKTKKDLYFALIKLLKLYRGLIWQASSEFEVNDIKNTLALIGVRGAIMNAPDLLSALNNQLREILPVLVDSEAQLPKLRIPGPLRLVFLSRISPKKNLDYLLRALVKVKMPVELSIYGPDEDALYWALCKDLIKILPRHVTITYHGEVNYEDVARSFAVHDLFVFPTRGENFGHVIYEALSVGTSVLVSDQTPWQADSRGALQVLALDHPDAWTDAINQWAAFDDPSFSERRAAAKQYAIDYIANSHAVQQNRSLFQLASGRH
jgi:glycosyltransferase involved in cell wall biosynthesis